MRGIAHATFVVLGLVATFAATPSEARGRELSAGLSATGSVFVTWHGDRARGCGAAGLCGDRGSAPAAPAEGGNYPTGGRRGPGGGVGGGSGGGRAAPAVGGG